MKTTTGIRHVIDVNNSKGNYSICIRLDDECNNGHQDFAITATFWEKGRKRIDRNMILAGCCHNAILNVRPDLKPFVDLHLCDWEGIPMYAIENGYYHLTNGFSDKQTPLKDQFCDYYRVTPDQFDILSMSRSSADFAFKIAGQGILTQWKKQGNEAILLLEELSGDKFTPASTKSNFHLTPQQVQEEERKQEEGYYTPEAIEKRKQDAIDKQLSAMENKFIAKLLTIWIEYSIQVELFKLGGRKYLENVIFYTHDKTIKFNWRGDNLTTEEIAHIKTALPLPAGIEYRN